MSASRNDDTVEITAIIHNLAHLADNCPDEDLTARYLPYFTDDAVWSLNNPTSGLSDSRTGHDDIMSGVATRRASGRQGPGSNVRHLITTVVVDIDGDGATSKAYALLLGDTDKLPTVLGVGHYSDGFVRTADGWKLSSRAIVFE